MQSNEPGLFLHSAPFLQGLMREQDTKSEMKTKVFLSSHKYFITVAEDLERFIQHLTIFACKT